MVTESVRKDWRQQCGGVPVGLRSPGHISHANQLTWVACFNRFYNCRAGRVCGCDANVVIMVADTMPEKLSTKNYFLPGVEFNA
jgi:hypothetical protein